MRHFILSERAAEGWGVFGQTFLFFIFFPLQQTTSEIGHRVKYFFRVGNQYAECHPSDPRRNVQAYRVFCLCFVWCPCMAINVIVQYNGGFLPDILLLTQAPTFVQYGSMALLLYTNTTLLTMCYSVFCLVMFGGSAWRLI